MRCWMFYLILSCSTISMVVTSTTNGAVKTYTKDQAKQIIKKAEEVRALDRSKALVKVETQSGRHKISYKMDVLQAPGRKAYLEFSAPDEERGRRMLAIKTNYWSKFPDSKRVVPISRREAIANSAFAIADVFQMGVEEDYDAKILGEEKYEAVDCYKVQLDAKHKDAPYYRIIYLVRTKDSYPVQAQFFGASGQKLKTMTIEKDAELAGRIRPSILKMVDDTTKERMSWWHTEEIEKKDVPDSVFSQGYLKGR